MAAAPAPIALTSTKCPSDITEGEINGCVTELQTLLNKNGARLTVDGDFGAATLAAVKSYQSSHGLEVDGIVGPMTKDELDGSTGGGARADRHQLLGVPGQHLRGRERRLRHRAADAAQPQRCGPDRGR